MDRLQFEGFGQSVIDAKVANVASVLPLTAIGPPPVVDVYG